MAQNKKAKEPELKGPGVHCVLYEAAIDAMEDLLQDRSVPTEKTLESMEELQTIIEGYIAGLRDDLE